MAKVVRLATLEAKLATMTTFGKVQWPSFTTPTIELC